MFWCKQIVVALQEGFDGAIPCVGKAQFGKPVIGHEYWEHYGSTLEEISRVFRVKIGINGKNTGKQ